MLVATRSASLNADAIARLFVLPPSANAQCVRFDQSVAVSHTNAVAHGITDAIRHMRVMCRDFSSTR